MGSNKDTQTQLQILGPMKDQVQYVDCEQRPQACEQAQIAAVPTWLIRGRKFVWKSSATKRLRSNGFIYVLLSVSRNTFPTNSSQITKGITIVGNVPVNLLGCLSLTP